MINNQNQFVFFILTGTLVLLVLVLFIILFFIFYNKRQNRNLKEKGLMQSQFQQTLLQTQIEIQEQTLKTISQEIHDNVGQILSLAKLNLNTFEDTESAYNQTKINDTRQLVSKAINDLRDLSRSLYGDRIAELGLHEAIANELKIMQNTGQFKAFLKITGDSFKLEPQKEMVLFRIVQESLNNAVKHSKAKNITVQMLYTIDELTLMITDDGEGFDPVALQGIQKGIGLKSMQDRATLIGGTFSLHSSAGGGTVITIQLNK